MIAALIIAAWQLAVLRSSVPLPSPSDGVPYIPLSAVPIEQPASVQLATARIEEVITMSYPDLVAQLAEMSEAQRMQVLQDARDLASCGPPHGELQQLVDTAETGAYDADPGDYDPEFPEFFSDA